MLFKDSMFMCFFLFDTAGSAQGIVYIWEVTARLLRFAIATFCRCVHRYVNVSRVTDRD